MKNLKRIAKTAPALLAFLCLLAATQAHAQAPQYLQALSNLRQARGWIQSDGRPQFRDLRAQAVDEINKAIKEISKAAKDDGANPNWTPPPTNPGAGPAAPLQAARNLLANARNEVASGQDIPQNMGLQVRALQHIDAARDFVRRIRELSGVR